MIVFVDSNGKTSLRELADFSHFKVLREARWSENTEEVYFDVEGHAWVSIEFLRAYGRQQNLRQWLEQLDAMIAYAASKQWLDPNSGRIRAHIEDA